MKNNIEGSSGKMGNPFQEGGQVEVSCSVPTRKPVAGGRRWRDTKNTAGYENAWHAWGVWLEKAWNAHRCVVCIYCSDQIVSEIDHILLIRASASAFALYFDM